MRAVANASHTARAIVVTGCVVLSCLMTSCASSCDIAQGCVGAEFYQGFFIFVFGNVGVDGAILLGPF